MIKTVLLFLKASAANFIWSEFSFIEIGFPFEDFLQICKVSGKSPCDFFNCKQKIKKNYNLKNVTLSEGSVFKNLVGDNNVNKNTALNLSTKEELSEQEVKKLQQRCFSTKNALKNAYKDIKRFKKQIDANLKLIEILSE